MVEHELVDFYKFYGIYTSRVKYILRLPVFPGTLMIIYVLKLYILAAQNNIFTNLQIFYLNYICM